MFLTRLLRRFAVPLALLAMAAAPRAFAQSPPGIDTTTVGYIQHVTIGRAACDTCPTIVCPGEPAPVTISGFLPGPCVQFRGFRELPVGAPFAVLQADFVADTCGKPCPAVLVPFSATAMLPAAFGSSAMFYLQQQVRSCPDTTVVAGTVSRQFTYAIQPDCFTPPPVDSLVRTFVSFELVPSLRCPGDSLTLRMRKNGCPPCVRLASLTSVPGATFQAVVDWQPQCVDFACFPESLSVPIGAFAAGLHLLRGDVTVRVLAPDQPDSSINYSQRLGFEVPLCQTACVMPQLPPGPTDPTVCAAVVPRGGLGVVTVPAASALDVWGAQGRLSLPGPLRILSVDLASGGPGAHLAWTRDSSLVRFVAFTTGGVPLLPAGRGPFLRVAFVVDTSAMIPPQSVYLRGIIDQAAGRDGEGLPLCAVPMREAPPTLRICITDAADTCDANGDGHADVRDLVRMVRCLRPDSTGFDSARTCHDCNADGVFDLGDLFCCARFILRAPQVPPDSVHPSSAVRVAFGEFRRAAEGWRVPVRVSGAGALAGTLLRLRYPAERWRAEVPPEVPLRAASDQGWLALTDVDEPGVVQLGWLKVGDGVAAELSFELLLVARAEPLPGDAIAVEGADLVLPDGTTLTPEEALPVASLTSPQPPQDVPASLALSPARPNPFTGSTRFSVSLPRETAVDLTVHDVAGRLVATLARGRFAAGVREFAWDGAGARDGVYFVRLSVDGRVLSQRVALLRGN